MKLLRGSTKLRLLLSALVGFFAGMSLWVMWEGHVALTVGITVGEVLFVSVTWALLWTMDEHETEVNAKHEDFNPVADEILIASASSLAIISMIALQFVGDAPAGPFAAVATLIGAFGAWACVHQTYALHYAYMYYRNPAGGIDFNQSESPRYSDFVYFSYAIGMTYGATDNSVTDRRIRTIVLRHALTSFVFGLLILGASVNLVAGLFFGLNG